MTTLSLAVASAAVKAADDTPPPISDAGNTQLVIAALLGIAAVVVLIVWAKMHPFLALMLGAAVLGAVAFVAPLDIVNSFTVGFGTTVGSVGLLIALGAMVGKILADSGGSDTIVDTIIGRVGRSGLPWAMALIAAILGLPLFFEVGVVLLVPVVILVARKMDVPVMRVGIPALAGLSILHGLVPPHPGPLVAIDNLGADLGLTLLLGLIVAIPTLIICGPLLAIPIERMVPVKAHAVPGTEPERPREEADDRPAATGTRAAGATRTEPAAEPVAADADRRRVDPGRGQLADSPLGEGVDHRPGFGAAVLCITLPVVLMLARAIGELTITDTENTARQVLDFIGTPAVALLAAVLLAMFLLGFGVGMNRGQVEKSLGSGLPGIAGILLIVAAGGGFKAMLVDAGVGNVIGDWANGSGISPLVLGWLVAVGVRLATGSATVATITASGIVSGVAGSLSSPELALLVLAIGCGSVFFSHVNDAGFWLVKEYFGLTVGQTLRSWSLMETAISVVGFALVMLVSVFV
jgi:GntP family gluconate:H+ symporter